METGFLSLVDPGKSRAASPAQASYARAGPVVQALSTKRLRGLFVQGGPMRHVRPPGPGRPPLSQRAVVAERPAQREMACWCGNQTRSGLARRAGFLRLKRHVHARTHSPTQLPLIVRGASHKTYACVPIPGVAPLLAACQCVGAVV